MDVDQSGTVFVSGGCNLWAVDRKNFSAPRLLSSTRRRGYGKVVAREEDLLVTEVHRNRVVAISKDSDGGDENDATVVVQSPSAGNAGLVGLALTPDGHVIVAEFYHRRVFKWSLNGTFAGVVAGEGARGVGRPYGLALSSDTGRVCSTTSNDPPNSLYCYSLDTSVPVELVKSGLSNPYHVGFDRDSNLWFTQYDIKGRLWVLTANGTEVMLELQGASAYNPVAMVVDVMDDARFFLLGREFGRVVLFQCVNPLSTRTPTTTSSSTSSATSSSTSSATSSSTSSATSSSTSSTNTGTSSTPPAATSTDTTPSTVEVTMGSTMPPGMTTGTSSPSPTALGTFTSGAGSTSAAAEGSSTADLGGNRGISGGVTTTLSAPPHTGVPLETSAVPMEMSGAPGSNTPKAALPYTATATPSSASETSAVPMASGDNVPSARAAATSTVALPHTSAQSKGTAVPTEMPAAPGDNVPSARAAATSTVTLPHTSAQSETAAAPAETAVLPGGNVPPANYFLVELESSGRVLVPHILLVLVAASAAL